MTPACGCGCGLDRYTCLAVSEAIGPEWRFVPLDDAGDACCVCGAACGAGAALAMVFETYYVAGEEAWWCDGFLCDRPECRWAFEERHGRYCGGGYSIEPVVVRADAQRRRRMRALLAARLCARLWKARARIAAHRRAALAVLRTPLDAALAHRIALMTLGRDL